MSTPQERLVCHIFPLVVTWALMLSQAQGQQADDHHPQVNETLSLRETTDQGYTTVLRQEKQPQQESVLGHVPAADFSIGRKQKVERARSGRIDDEEEEDNPQLNATLKVLHGECTAEGFFGMPGQCRNFFQCYMRDGTLLKVQLQCPPGTVFDTKRGLCDHPWAAAKSECGHDNPNQKANDTWDKVGQWTGRSSTENGSDPVERGRQTVTMSTLIKQQCPSCPPCQCKSLLNERAVARSSGHHEERNRRFWSYVLVLVCCSMNKIL